MKIITILPADNGYCVTLKICDDEKIYVAKTKDEVKDLLKMFVDA